MCVDDDNARMLGRADLLLEIATDLQQQNVLPPDRILLRPARVALVARAYFILNDAYKRWRIEDDHFTQDPKIAALQSLCIMRIEPFQLLNPDDAQTVAEARSNAIYALACASAVLGFDIMSLKGDSPSRWLRILDILSRTTCDTIEMVINDVNLQIEKKKNDYKLAIVESDKQSIDTLITIFELIDSFDASSVG